MTGNGNPSDSIDVAFVGRANIDLTIRVPHRSRPGRTAVGSSLSSSAGGKSLNQAIAAARRGGRAALIANVGVDAWGQQIAAALIGAGVDTRHVRAIPGTTTGAAIIEVTPDGESYITLALSPATELTANDIHQATTGLATRAVVAQLDLPPEPVAALLGQRRAPVVIGNLIPHPDLDPAVLRHLDVLVVNQHEAAAILHTSIDSPLDAATALQRLGPRTVVVTAGPHGAAYTHPHGSGTVPAPAVQVIDTTGAGDAFLGSLALGLARHTPLPDAITAAVHAGSDTVQHAGAVLT
ncbi:ribokinase [Micromonospora qiuiae]|uniref:Ribokinase n=1 Tax=Micromonospora qiuiae TaxID=502268 RepID=A0ABQ4JK72_9ACTN|nr:PfkB family carbohydrate kinase [Micromonospora qiuiae]GIJ30770.1 ribokinase [Micromonospora qiuiae]